MKKYRIRKYSVAYWVQGLLLMMMFVSIFAIPNMVFNFIDPLLP